MKTSEVMYSLMSLLCKPFTAYIDETTTCCHQQPVSIDLQKLPKMQVPLQVCRLIVSYYSFHNTAAIYQPFNS